MKIFSLCHKTIFDTTLVHTEMAYAWITENVLAALPSISDGIIVHNQFLSNVIYITIGTSALVALNPHKYIASYTDPLSSGVAEYRGVTEEKEYLPPHIFQLRNNEYCHVQNKSGPKYPYEDQYLNIIH